MILKWRPRLTQHRRQLLIGNYSACLWSSSVKTKHASNFKTNNNGARISTISCYLKKIAKCRILINIFYLNTVNVIDSTFLNVLRAESNEIRISNLVIVLWHFIMYGLFITIVNDRLNDEGFKYFPKLKLHQHKLMLMSGDPQLVWSNTTFWDLTRASLPKITVKKFMKWTSS